MFQIRFKTTYRTRLIQLRLICYSLVPAKLLPVCFIATDSSSFFVSGSCSANSSFYVSLPMFEQFLMYGFKINRFKNYITFTVWNGSHKKFAVNRKDLFKLQKSFLISKIFKDRSMI